MSDNLITLVQPNAVTNARYEFSQIEKDIMYFVIEALQGYMKKELPLPSERDLFGQGGIAIILEMKQISKANNHSKVKEHIRGLMRKPIVYHLNKDNRMYEVGTNLISGYHNEKNKGKITLKVPIEAVPVLVNMAAGFTAYNKNIALSLPSVYAKRMYELCCRWKDKGFLRISLDDFRKMFCIEDKHDKISDLRESVLDMAQKMLNDYADLQYRYELKKENNSRSFNYLYIWITSANQDPKDKANQRAYEIIFNFLYELFRNSKAQEITDIIANNKELKRAAERITRLKNDIKTGKIKKHGQDAYIRKVIQDEFKIPPEVMGESPKKRKKKEDGENILASLMEKKAKELAEQEKKKQQQKPTPQEMVKSLFQEPAKRGTGTKSLGAMLRGE